MIPGQDGELEAPAAVELSEEDQQQADAISAAMGTPVEEEAAGDKPEGDTPAGDKPAGEAPEGDKPEGDKAAGDEPAGEPAAGEKTAEEKAAAEKAEADAATKAAADAKVEADKKAEESKNAERDADLGEYEKKVEPGLRPKFKKVVNEFKEKVKAARNEADAAKKAATEAATKLAELEKAPKPTVPKEMEDELKSLREKVRELDITQDPVLKTKYDSKITKIVDAATAILKTQGLGKKVTADGKTLEDDPDFNEANFKKSTSPEELLEKAEMLRSAGDFKSAAKLGEAARQIQSLQDAKAAEIADWQANFESRKQATSAEQQAAQAKIKEFVKTEYVKSVDAERATLEKLFPMVKQPTGPQPNDPPAVAAAKTKAVEEFQGMQKSIVTALEGFNTNAPGISQEEAAKRYAAFNTAATMGVLFKSHLFPKIQKDLSEKDARITQLESELSKIKKSGAISRVHGNPPPTKKETDLTPGSEADALSKAMQAAMGNLT